MKTCSLELILWKIQASNSRIQECFWAIQPESFKASAHEGGLFMGLCSLLMLDVFFMLFFCLIKLTFTAQIRQKQSKYDLTVKAEKCISVSKVLPLCGFNWCISACPWLQSNELTAPRWCRWVCARPARTRPPRAWRGWSAWSSSGSTPPPTWWTMRWAAWWRSSNLSLSPSGWRRCATCALTSWSCAFCPNRWSLPGWVNWAPMLLTYCNDWCALWFQQPCVCAGGRILG